MNRSIYHSVEAPRLAKGNPHQASKREMLPNVGNDKVKIQMGSHEL